jgi:hypothetical protein
VFLKGVLVEVLKDGKGTERLQKISDFTIDQINTVCRTIPVGKIVEKGTSSGVKSNGLIKPPVNPILINPPFSTCTLEANEITSTGTVAAEGAAVDVAKYTIRGNLDASQITDKGNHVIAFQIVHILRPIQSAEKIFSLTISDNNYLVGRVIVDPQFNGETQILPFTLQNVFTDCIKIPFVSGQMAIGINDPSAFGAQLWPR